MVFDSFRLYYYNVSSNSIRGGKRKSPVLVYIGFKSYITPCKCHGQNRVKEPVKKETARSNPPLCHGHYKLGQNKLKHSGEGLKN